MNAQPEGPAADPADLQAQLTAAPSWAVVRQVSIALLGAAPSIAPATGRDLAEKLEDAIIALLSEAGKPDAFSFDVQAFHLPAVFERWAYATRRRAYWELQCERFRLQIRSAPSPKERGIYMLRLLFCDAVLAGVGPAIRAFLDGIIEHDPPTMLRNLPLPLPELGRTLQRSGWHAGNVEVLVDALLPRGPRSQDPLVIAWTGLLCASLFLAPDFSDTLMDPVYRRIVIPVLRMAGEKGELLSLAGAMEKHIYGSYLKRHEHEGRFAEVYAEIGPLLASCGSKLASSTSDSASRESLGVQPPSVVFVVQSPSLLAHTAMLLTFFRGLRQLKDPPVVPMVWFLENQGATAELLEALTDLGVSNFIAANQDQHPLVELQALIKHRRIAAAIFVSLPFNLSLAAGMRLAPAVIWWSMRYHRFALPEIDGYMTTGGFFEDYREIEGRSWRSCRSALPPLTEPGATAHAAGLRASLGLSAETLVLGCIGRDEKMLGAGYLDAVAEVLKACENTVFVWTGRVQVRAGDVQRRLEELGIAARCRFLGWLPNTKAVAPVLDVYLDSFPFASGHTGFEAMAVGVPLVVMASDEALASSTLTSFVPTLEGRAGSPADQEAVRSIFAPDGGERLVPHVDTADQYVTRAIALVRDAGLRQRVGNAGRRFVERFARDEKTFAASTCRHILDIMAETRAAKGGEHSASV